MEGGLALNVIPTTTIAVVRVYLEGKYSEMSISWVGVVKRRPARAYEVGGASEAADWM